MATTQDKILRWLQQGKAIGATHLVIVCDTFDWEDYPVFVLSNEDARSKAGEYNKKEMQRVMEVYSLSHDWNAQLNEFRAFHFD